MFHLKILLEAKSRHKALQPLLTASVLRTYKYIFLCASLAEIHSLWVQKSGADRVKLLNWRQVNQVILNMTFFLFYGVEIFFARALKWSNTDGNGRYHGHIQKRTLVTLYCQVIIYRSLARWSDKKYQTNYSWYEVSFLRYSSLMNSCAWAFGQKSARMKMVSDEGALRGEGWLERDNAVQGQQYW